MKVSFRARRRLATFAASAHLGLLLHCGGQDLSIGHFAASDYGDWVRTGRAFNPGPASGEALARLEIENASGNSVASSEMEGDGPTGTLSSPEFEIARNYIAFRIGGGDYERDTCLDLLIDGRVVKRATGWRSDRLVPDSWDVRAFRGRQASIQIVDRATGDWGHINVDHVVQTDNPERMPITAGPLYQEALRPQFHFTARQWTMNRLNPGMQQEGWVNDLNGLIYYDGEYHLFAQRWAKCWIHAVTRDLIHWTELEPAFWEEHPGSGDQSGTCIIDYKNTSGLAPDKSNPPMIAFYPRWDNRNQCIAYSLDHGRTWKHYEKNPILVHRERDPKVFWYAPANHWVMMLYGDGQYHILTSPNLLSWTDKHHPIKDSFECPDFFELPVDGDRNQKKWVLIQGNGNYSIGSFDGVEFKEETKRHPCDVGPNFYATQSWHNTETGDGRRIQTAWMRGPNFPDMPFNQQISFPCELTLRKTTNGLRIFRKPIVEIALLHKNPDTWTNRTLEVNQELPLEPAGRLFHIRATLNIADRAKAIFNVRGNPVTLTSKTIESGGQPIAVAGRIETLEMLVDVASIEAFVNGGEISATRFALPRDSGLYLKAEGGSVFLESLAIYPLESAWTNPAVKSAAKVSVPEF
jgi:sucrose-6-phosphate hydrolase SacC (GH32 family)